MINNSVRLSALLVIAGLGFNSYANDNIVIKGAVEASVLFNNYDKDWLTPWLEQGVGLHRYNANEKFAISHALMEFDATINSDWSVFAVANFMPDGDSHIGFTEAYAKYSPLTPNVKHQVKIGYFYPQFSLENSDLGWTSPYTFNFSAINSWVAEEVRPLGIEWQVKRPGKIHNSNHSFTATVAAYAQNDGLASLLAWRGWAIHNRQSLIGEKVYFADYLQFQSSPNPPYVDINDETDHRVGYYVGAHWQYKNRTDARVYYYDNMADPFSIETDMQYGWRTRFTSIALLHKFSKEFRILAQVMTGDTEMGNLTKGVLNEFQSWYVLLNYKLDKQRFSIRYDDFEVIDIDTNAEDPNDSNGSGITASWRYEYSESLHLGLELQKTDSTNVNREFWDNWQAKQSQTTYSLAAQYRF